MKHKSWWLVAIFVILTLVLSGCITMDMTLNLGSDENWEVVNDIIINEELIAFAEEMGEEMDFSELETELDGSVEDIQDEYGDQVEVYWEPLPSEESEVGYRMVASGQGYDTLNEAMFDGQASFTTGTEGGKDVVYVEIGGMGVDDVFGEDMGETEDMGDMGDMMEFEIRFTVTGKEILETNGTLSDDGSSATWINESGTYTATVVTGGGFPTWGYVVIGLVCLLMVVVVIVAVVVVVVLNKKKKEKEGEGGESEAPAE